jgi:hypothetical protein
VTPAADSSAAGGGPLTTGEKKEALESDLDSSLSEFDRKLLREQEILAQEEAARAAAAGNGTSGGGGGGEGGGSSGSGGSSGEAIGDEGATETADVGGNRTSAGGSGGSPDTPQGEPSGAGAPVGGEEDAESSNGRIPPDVGDGSGDDIVARQLREAAMKEEDPELREKLWDEYRAYKNGTTKSDK